MFQEVSSRQEYSRHPQSSQEDTVSLSARDNQTNRTFQTGNRGLTNDNELPDSQAEGSEETKEHEELEEGELTEDDQDWVGETVPQLPERPTTTIGYPHTLQLPETTTIVSPRSPERPTTTTISDDRSHGSEFQRDAARHLLNALVPHIVRQKQKLPSGDSSHSAIQLLLRSGIDPASLAPSQFDMFQKQSEAVQQTTVKMYAANLEQERLSRAPQAATNQTTSNAHQIHHRLVQPQPTFRPALGSAPMTPRDRERDGAETDAAAQQSANMWEQPNKKRRMMIQQEHDGESAEILSQSTAGPGGPADSDESMVVIASALGIPAEAATSLETLQSYIADLQSHSRSQNPYRHQIIHRVNDQDGRMYFDHPQWLRHEVSSKRIIAGNLPLVDLNIYLAKYPEVSFIVYREYKPSLSKDEDITDDDFQEAQKPKHSQEYLAPVTKELANAISRFLKHLCGFTTEYKEATVTLWAPYVHVYHNRGHALKGFLATLQQPQRDQFQLLLDYITPQYSQEWAIVDDMIKRRKITSEYIGYLFKPGDVLVRGKHQNARGFSCTSWLSETDHEHMHSTHPKSPRGPAKKIYKIEVSHWDFDKAFKKRNTQLGLQVTSNDALEIDIADLSVRPLRLMDPSLLQTLRCRGHRFWKCRKRCLVSYHEDEGREYHSSSDDRYMIDMEMHRELHKSYPVGGDAEELEPTLMEQGEPPDNDNYRDFIYLVPPTIKAFNLKSKKWVDLQVNRINDVVWNDEAFKSLVIKEKTKQLIQALISNQINAKKSTDLISGKGNGLVMLLHGGPGTRKTLTAESMAEVARRPLYPVTCGDIRTNPKHIENYLKSVFHIGKTWKCVVLLDEADVFLEERSFENLQRNALVSIFLRALEYYDGILILTSNRVGHFDEAFKSRIQLAIQYKPLDKDQRTEIWKNFIRRLKTLEEDDVNFADLKDHIPDLAKGEMNGREIRNIITTGRQFVKWKRQQPNGGNCLLNYEMLRGDVLQPVAEFDEYLGELYGGNSSEQLARQDGKR